MQFFRRPSRRLSKSGRSQSSSSSSATIKESTDSTTSGSLVTSSTSPPVMESLLAPSADTDTLIDTIKSNSSIDRIKVILTDQKVRQTINKRDTKGKTALHWSVDMDRLDIVEALLELNNIDDTIFDDNGYTAMDLCKSKKVCIFLEGMEFPRICKFM